MGGEDGVGRAMDACARIFAQQSRAWRRLLKLPAVSWRVAQTGVGTTSQDVVLQIGSMRLLRYRRDGAPRYADPVLICYALVNRFYVLDLQPDRSVVRQYLQRGFEVYIIDWGTPSDADRGLTLNDYVCRFLEQAVAHVTRAHARRDLHLLGYCMGGTLSTLFAALNPERVKTLTLLAAPIDFGGRDCLVNLWADREAFDVDAFIDAHGNCPAWFLQACFLSLKPVQNFVEKGLSLYELMDDDHALTSFFAMERWINDNTPVAGETFREFVKKLYQRNELVRGELRIGERLIDLGRVTCPLLLLTAKNDHLVAPGSTEGIRPHVGSRDVKSLTIDAGHVGLVVSRRAQTTIWAEATRWAAEHSTLASAMASPIGPS